MIIKSIIELTTPLGNCGLVENRSRRSNRFEEDGTVFYENNGLSLE